MNVTRRARCRFTIYCLSFKRCVSHGSTHVLVLKTHSLNHFKSVLNVYKHLVMCRLLYFFRCAVWFLLTTRSEFIFYAHTKMLSSLNRKSFVNVCAAHECIMCVVCKSHAVLRFVFSSPARAMHLPLDLHYYVQEQN